MCIMQICNSNKDNLVMFNSSNINDNWYVQKVSCK